jgi:RNA polymerase sigma-70 factor, ECF subfamily
MSTLLAHLPLSRDLFAVSLSRDLSNPSLEAMCASRGTSGSARVAEAGSLSGALRNALDRFFRSIERRAFKIAMLSLKSTDDALDAVQDAMTQFVRSYSTKPEADWSRLFYTVLDSKLTDKHRRNSTSRRYFGLLPGRYEREAESETDSYAQLIDEQQFDPSVLVDSISAGKALEAALPNLPERQRQAFLLRLWEGFDVAQTASIMRCSEGSVKTHLSRALSALRNKLQAFQPDAPHPQASAQTSEETP